MTSGLAYRDLPEIVAALADMGARQLFAKFLAPNDNSKNQPYLAKGNLAALNMFPVGPITEDGSGGSPTFKAPFPLFWVTPSGELERAPGSQLIVYPAYPEVRLSGFLRGTKSGPNALMSTRLSGRIMLLAVTNDRRVIGLVLHPDSPAAVELVQKSSNLEREGVLAVIPLGGKKTSRENLLAVLGEIHRAGWVDSVRLTSHGLVACSGTNCGGCTLEALLGIPSNSVAGPDFDGWEIKGHLTRSFSSSPTGQVTLMTPAPTGGIAKRDIVKFVQTFGYADGADDARTNFSSPHRVGSRNPKTGLTATLLGYDVGADKIRASGSFALTTDTGEVAAEWDFASMMEKWTHKHAKAAFVPYMANSGMKQYAYGSRIKLGEGTDFLRFLRQMALGHVAYDPGIWIRDGKPGKSRSQFRVAAKHVPGLYHSVSEAMAT